MSDRKDQSEGLMSEDSGGWMANFLADEDELDRRALWRLGSWGAGTVGAMIVGILATQSPTAIRRDQLASVDVAQQSQQVQWIAKESQNQARQLAAAVETLNSDRDRLYARVTVLEQGLDSVTGSVARQNAVATLPSIPVAPQSSAPSNSETTAPPSLPEKKTEAPPPPKIAPVATIPAPTLQTASKQPDQKSDPISPERTEPSATGAVSSTEPPPSADAAVKPVARTEFGIDLGGANSVEGLRALWRGVTKSNGAQIASLTPIIVVKERTDGLGMQLRLVAGPLNDAAATAKICATLIASNRACETSVYNGQRLALQNDAKPESKQSQPKKRARAKAEEPANTKSGSFSSIFGIR